MASISKFLDCYFKKKRKREKKAASLGRIYERR